MLVVDPRKRALLSDRLGDVADRVALDSAFAHHPVTIVCGLDAHDNMLIATRAVADDPLAGHLPLHAGHGRGGGLWVVRRMTRRVDTVSSSCGLTTRLWI